jgi:hypothetical protein
MTFSLFLAQGGQGGQGCQGGQGGARNVLGRLLRKHKVPFFREVNIFFADVDSGEIDLRFLALYSNSECGVSSCGPRIVFNCPVFPMFPSTNSSLSPLSPLSP